MQTELLFNVSSQQHSHSDAHVVHKGRMARVSPGITDCTEKRLP